MPACILACIRGLWQRQRHTRTRTEGQSLSVCFSCMSVCLSIIFESRKAIVTFSKNDISLSFSLCGLTSRGKGKDRGRRRQAQMDII